MKTKQITTLVKERFSQSPNGTECVFVKINDKWAIKLYDSKSNRDSCYKWQKKAAKYGLGPDVGGIIDLPDEGFRASEKYHEDYEDYIPLYGYITEIVDVVADQDDYDNDADWRNALFRAKSDEYCYEFDRLCEELDEIGFSCEDLFSGNVGYKNGKMICIDFGYQYDDLDDEYFDDLDSNGDSLN